jgi:hypothetical protein
VPRLTPEKKSVYVRSWSGPRATIAAFIPAPQVPCESFVLPQIPVISQVPAIEDAMLHGKNAEVPSALARGLG